MAKDKAGSTNEANDTMPACAELQRALGPHGIKAAVSELADLEPEQRAALRQWVDDGGNGKLPAFAERFQRGTPASAGKAAGKPKASKGKAKAAAKSSAVPAGDLTESQRLMLQLDDEIIAHNKIVRKAHDEWVEAKETLAERSKVYQAEQKRLSELVDDLEAIKGGNFNKRLPYPDEDSHPDVAAGKNRTGATPALEETAKAQAAKGKGKPKAAAKAKADPPEAKKRQCVKCNHIYEVQDVKADDRCPECDTTAYTIPSIEGER